MTRNATFSAANVTRTLPVGSYRVYRFGEAAIVRSLDRASDVVQQAARLDSDAHAVDCDGARVC